MSSYNLLEISWNCPRSGGGILPYINHSTVVRNLKIVRKSKVNGTQFHFFWNMHSIKKYLLIKFGFSFAFIFYERKKSYKICNNTKNTFSKSEYCLLSRKDGVETLWRTALGDSCIRSLIQSNILYPGKVLLHYFPMPRTTFIFKFFPPDLKESNATTLSPLWHKMEIFMTSFFFNN